MLECIEEFVNYLLDKNKYYKKNNILYIQFKNVKSLIEEEKLGCSCPSFASSNFDSLN